MFGNALDTMTGSLGYEPALDAIAPNFTSMVSQTSVPGESWVDTAQRLLTAIVVTDQQRQMLNIQLARAKQGLPPLSNADYGLGVSVGVNSDTSKMVMYVGAGLALAYLVGQLISSRRG